MGAWGLGNFENDSAMDWLVDFAVKPELSVIEEPFNTVLNATEFIDSEESFVALAASEIIAACGDLPCNDFPEDISLKELKPLMKLETISRAIQVIYKILHFEQHSELRELWQESDEYEDWIAIQNELIKRLKDYLTNTQT
jgi:hypothetical protein